MRDKQQNDSSSSVSRSELIPLPASRSASGARVTTLELPAYLPLYSDYDSDNPGRHTLNADCWNLHLCRQKKKTLRQMMQDQFKAPPRRFQAYTA